MRLLIVDPAGAALDLAVRAQNCGHTVKHFIRDTPKTAAIGAAMTTVIRDLAEWMRWPDLVFCADNTMFMRDVDTMRRSGIPVVGASPETAMWELDRDKGMSVLRSVGIKTPPSKAFSSYDDAIAHVKSTMKRFVSKPSGDADKALSYVAKSPADLVYMLERWKANDKLKGDFILQDFVPGVEMAVGGWHGPHGFNAGWLENWEFKKLMVGDLGVATGEQGTVMRYVKQSRLADQMLVPLKRKLAKARYVGYIDVNCIVDEHGQAWPLEFTMRPGWPTFNIEQALRSGDSVQWLLDLARGADTASISYNEIALGIVLSIPDYPYSHLTHKQVEGTPIYGVTPGMWKSLHPCEMAMGVAPFQIGDKIESSLVPVTAGDYVLVMSATGPDVVTAKQRALRRLARLIVPNSPMWRTDIGDRLNKQLPKLQAHGLAKGMIYRQTA